jgi:pyridoxal phosphate enzyme (YggS family)
MGGNLVTERLAAVEERIARAAASCGRRRDEIRLLAVTKTFPAEAIEAAYAAGLREFGENYVQEFEGKQARVRTLAGARFHLIGHLQSNKARRAAELFESIDTVDSAKLARRLEETERPLDVFIEVKLSEEGSKAGVEPGQLSPVVEAVRAARHLRLCGLMTVPPWSEDAEVARPYFRRLAELARAHGISGLNMGMSHDFEVAIAEGATVIRVGTALFGRRPRKTAVMMPSP